MIEYFPDGAKIDEWFYDISDVDVDSLGKKYYVTDFGVFDNGKIYTEQIQGLIDKISQSGGGVLVIPKGVYFTGALFFKQGVNLYIEEGGVLKGSDYVTDYPILTTRIEGETCSYLSALINVDGVDGFTIFGRGAIDGNGERAWQAFWHRRKWNPQCTNKDEQRPRLIYISNSKNVTIRDCTLQNSQYWTTHLYKCENVKYLGVKITSPKGLAPSTDAIDIDVCSNVLIKNCYFAVNDDAVVLKGGKGPTAHTLKENGMNERIIIEDCEFGFCHGCLTCGSESLHNKNVIFRRAKINNATRLLWLKLRPDTIQHYEYIRVEQVFGEVNYMLYAMPWTQFFDMKGVESLPPSKVNDVEIKDCKLKCKTYLSVSRSDRYKLQDFTFSNLEIKTQSSEYEDGSIDNLTKSNITVEFIKII